MRKIRKTLARAAAAVAIAAAAFFAPFAAYADLQGIDISNWQSGINVASVPGDFAIVKVSQGTWYTSPSWRRQADQTTASGKLLGLYHYAEGTDVYAEANHFIEQVRASGYLGKAVLVIDWESQDNSGYWRMEDWVGPWCDYVYQQTGVKPMVYCSQSIMRNFDDEIGDYGLWVAQYANNSATGYQSHPWNEGTYACAMRQYSSHGRLSGYSGNLDLNKFYGDRSAWLKYAGAERTDTNAWEPDYGQIASDVIAGKYGNGDERKQKLGSMYEKVQGIVNSRLSSQSANAEPNPPAQQAASTYTVRRGDCLSIIGQRLGVSWQSIASANGIRSPYVIYAGQRLTIPGASASAQASRTYTVRSGDCLSVIGGKTGVSWTRIAQLNGIRSPYTIYPGQVLRLA